MGEKGPPPREAFLRMALLTEDIRNWACREKCTQLKNLIYFWLCCHDSEIPNGLYILKLEFDIPDW